LTSLTQISLVSNQFTGGIPSDISNLVNLNNLYLSNNQFSGPLPSEIGFLSLSNLTLDGNQFTGPIPPSYGNLTNLNQLDLSDNSLTGCYDPALTTLCTWSNIRISDGNSFDAAWQDYCMTGAGACVLHAHRFHMLKYNLQTFILTMPVMESYSHHQMELAID